MVVSSCGGAEARTMPSPRRDGSAPGADGIAKLGKIDRNSCNTGDTARGRSASRAIGPWHFACSRILLGEEAMSSSLHDVRVSYRDPVVSGEHPSLGAALRHVFH